MNEKFCILFQMSLKFVPKGQNDSNPVLVQEMARPGTGKKPLSEPIFSQFTEEYMQPQGKMS